MIGLPSITVSFREKGITAIQRSQRGIILMLLHDTVPTGSKFLKYDKIFDLSDIPSNLSDDNKKQIELAMIGYQTAPYKIIALVYPTATPIADMLATAETLRFTYIVYPAATKEASASIATWIKQQRTQKDNMFKAVLFNTAADNEGVINVTNKYFVVGDTEYTGAQYCSRIAGLICGTPNRISCTYAPLPEVSAVEYVDKETLNSRIDKGEFVVIDDGETIKVARGVNSFVTTIDGKGKSFRKIKLVETMDIIHDDIVKTAEDNYLGKYNNNYDNRCLLITAIFGYFKELENSGLLEVNQNTVEINLETTKIYLLKNGRKTKEEIAKMSDMDLKVENVGDNVFLKASISMLDAIESIDLPISI